MGGRGRVGGWEGGWVGGWVGGRQGGWEGRREAEREGGCVGGLVGGRDARGDRRAIGGHRRKAGGIHRGCLPPWRDGHPSTYTGHGTLPPDRERGLPPADEDSEDARPPVKRTCRDVWGSAGTGRDVHGRAGDVQRREGDVQGRAGTWRDVQGRAGDVQGRALGTGRGVAQVGRIVPSRGHGMITGGSRNDHGRVTP